MRYDFIVKIHIETDPKNDQPYWFSEDRRFYGAVVAPFELEALDEPKSREAFPAGAILSVPKHSPGERPSLNKYSPLIVQAPSIAELVPLLEAWVDQNAGKKLWDLRRMG